MITNLFSMFDPVGIRLFSGVWVIWLRVILLLVSSPTLILRGPLSILSVILCFIKSEIDSLVGSHSYLSPVLIGVFISTLILNSIGLIPYALTITSFMPHNLTLAFSLWLGPVMFSVSQSLNSWLAHLLPLGTPYKEMLFYNSPVLGQGEGGHSPPLLLLFLSILSFYESDSHLKR